MVRWKSNGELFPATAEAFTPLPDLKWLDVLASLEARLNYLDEIAYES